MKREGITMKQLDILTQGRHDGLKCGRHFWVQNVLFWHITVGSLSALDALFFNIFIVRFSLMRLFS